MSYSPPKPLALAHNKQWIIHIHLPHDIWSALVLCWLYTLLPSLPYTVNPVEITVQPAPQLLIVPGQPASFTVTATGDSRNYQWQKGGDDITTGATSATYTISSVMESDEGMYRCVVSNAVSTKNSNAASLTVCKYMNCCILVEIINPRRTCARVRVVVLCCVCVCVCVSVTSILPSRTFRCQTKSISGYSAENTAKLKGGFL